MAGHLESDCQQTLNRPEFLPSNLWSHQKLPLLQLGTIPAAKGAQDDVQETRTSSTEQPEYERTRLASPDDVDIREKKIIQRKLDKVSRWLAAVDHTQKHIETHNKRQPGTCTWFPKTATYNAWRTGKTAFLWLNAQAGCGKSVLIASTIEHLKTTLEGGEVLVYFYCDFQNERSTRPTEMLRSILSQLFRHFGDSGVDPGPLLNLMLEQMYDGTLSLDDFDQLAHWVLRTSCRFRHKPIIVIEALDECGNVEEFLRAFTMWPQADVRLLVTSRPQENIAHHFRKRPSLSLGEMGKQLAADIGLHITHELFSHAQLRSADTKTKNEVRRKLHQKAKGRFRWVQCQLDTLKRCSTTQELQAVLDNLPGELQETYERILGMIDERRSEGGVARRALSWLMVALVPLRLTQLVEGLSVDPRERYFNRGKESLGPALVFTLASLVSYNPQTDVIALSHYTVKEYLMSRTAIPMYHIIPYEAHAEVSEMCMFYVTMLLKLKPFHANRALLESFPMLSYVFAAGFDHLAHVNMGSVTILDVLHTFAWHVQHHPSHWDLLCELREEDSRRPYPPWPSSRHDLVLYILIAYSSIGLLQSFLSRGRPLKARAGTNPLVYAADLWKTEQAMALLGSGVDANASRLVVDDSRHATPLEVAVDLGNDVLVGELLRRGCLITWEMISTAVYKPWCSTRVLAQLVQSDEFAQWAHAIGDEELYRCVFNTARPNSGDSSQTDKDHVALARRLREVGLGLSPESSFGDQLIKRVLHGAHTSMLEYLLPPDQPPPSRFLITACTANTSEAVRVSVVRFLLRKGVNACAISGERKDTALHLAAMSLWEPHALELTKILLDAGGDPAAQNRRGETPLVIAMRRGHRSLVEHLLSRNAPLPSYILLLALQRRERAWMIRSLIRKGADIHACTSRGDKVLHLAVLNVERAEYKWKDEEHTSPQAGNESQQGYERVVSQDIDEDEDWYADEDDMYNLEQEYEEVERLELVKIFIEAGCNPISRGAKGRTVLQHAINCGYVSVAELLHSCGAPLPPNTLSDALYARHLPPQMIEFLIRRGADGTAPDGNTVLHSFISEYDESACLELVKTFVNSCRDLTSRGAEGRRVLVVAVIRGYTSVVDHLLSYQGNDFLLPETLPNALQWRLTPEIVELLVHKGADVHATTSDGDTVLHLAVTAGYTESKCLKLIQVFIDAGCSPTSRGSKDRMILQDAIELGYTSVVECLLSCDVPLPLDILSHALLLGSTPRMVEFLITKGADVHGTAPGADTVLHLCVTEYDEPLCLELVKILVKAGCIPTAYSSEGRTVLEAAVRHGYTSVVEYLYSYDVRPPPDILPSMLQLGLTPRMAEVLVRKGANVNATAPTGDTVLHLTISEYDEPPCLELIKIFLGAGCDPTFHGSEDRTVLQDAIERGYTSVVEYLLSSRCDVPLPPSILPHALLLGSAPHMVEFLIIKGADVYATAPGANTVLHLCVTEYDEPLCLELVKILVKAGCIPTAYSSEGRTVLETAVTHGYTSVVEYLFSCGVRLPHDILQTALQRGLNPEMAKFLVHKGADVDSMTLSGDTLLHPAILKYAESTCLELVKIFVEAGCFPTHCNAKGKTVWRAAMERGYTSVVELLLSSNVPRPPDILLMALRYRLTPVLIYSLIRIGVSAHITTAIGDTALHLIISGYLESVCLGIVSRVIEAGCNPNSCNSEGKSVLVAAIEVGYASVVELLLRYYNVKLPADILIVALQLRATPQMVRILIRNGADVRFTTSRGDTLLQIAHALYTEPDRQRVIEILDSSRGTKRGYGSFGDEISICISKRRRLGLTDELGRYWIHKETHVSLLWFG